MIIINDGSTDTTGTVLEKYRGNAQVKVITQKNKGFSGARNAGIDRASGKYVMFLDSDDTLLPGSIECLMNCAIRENADVVAGNFFLTYLDGTKIEGSAFKSEQVNPRGTYYGQPWGKVYRKEMFYNLRFPEGYWYEDSIFAQIVWPMCRKCFTVSDYVYGYYQNEKGITALSKGQPKSIDSYYITRELLQDKERFGLELTEDDYVYFMRMVKLTYRRTMYLKQKVRKSIFLGQCELLKRYFSEFKASSPKYAEMETALASHNYGKYVKNCLK